MMMRKPRSRSCWNCGETFIATWSHYCDDCPYRSRPHVVARERAGGIVSSAVKNGALPRVKTLKCVDCGEPAQCYDHRDYSKPLDVVPTCYGCNAKRGPAIGNKPPFRPEPPARAA